MRFALTGLSLLFLVVPVWAEPPVPLERFPNSEPGGSTWPRVATPSSSTAMAAARSVSQ